MITFADKDPTPELVGSEHIGDYGFNAAGQDGEPVYHDRQLLGFVALGGPRAVAASDELVRRAKLEAYSRCADTVAFAIRNGWTSVADLAKLEASMRGEAGR